MHALHYSSTEHIVTMCVHTPTNFKYMSTTCDDQPLPPGAYHDNTKQGLALNLLIHLDEQVSDRLRQQ